MPKAFRNLRPKESPFYYAQPSGSLVEGIAEPDLPLARKVTFEQWPKSLGDIAVKMAELAR